MLNVTVVHHLALFICHLFIDGNFRTAHFLYKPNTFEFDWLLKIDRVCPEPIPLYLTDITLPWDWPWNADDNKDNVLQLCFFDPSQLSKDINELQSKGDAYYRVFAFDSVAMADKTKGALALKALRQLPHSNDLIVHYKPKNVSVYPNNGMSTEQNPILIVDEKTNFAGINLFDHTFGEFERSHAIALNLLLFVDSNGVETAIRFRVDVLILHYYHQQLNNSYINMTWVDLRKNIVTNKICAPQPRNYYKELSSEYKCIEMENS